MNVGNDMRAKVGVDAVKARCKRHGIVAALSASTLTLVELRPSTKLAVKAGSVAAIPCECASTISALSTLIMQSEVPVSSKHRVATVCSGHSSKDLATQRSVISTAIVGAGHVNVDDHEVAPRATEVRQ